MRKAIHLLFYPTSVVENRLDEMRESPQFSPWTESSQKDNILQFCLYLIERDSDFSAAEVIYETNGRSDSYADFEFSSEMTKELERTTG